MDIDGKLQEVAEALRSGQKPVGVTARDFIGWFGAKRRRGRAVETIRTALRKFELITVPDFQQAYIDEEISFALRQRSEDQSETDSLKAPPIGDDPTQRIKKLDAANLKPISINPDAPLSDAITLMMAYEYSQLPVMTTPYEVKGVISWESIGKRLALGLPSELVNDCMEKKYTEIPSDESLLSAIQRIEEDEYVLVRNPQNQISGIVTSSDLSREFHRLGEPFLLIGEIENYVRIMIQPHFTLEELSEAKDPNDTDRQVQYISDLTFGEYIRLIQNETHWHKLRLEIDRQWFVKELDRIREVRNNVMHFDPDGIEEAEIETLRTFVRLLQELAELNAIPSQSHS